MMQALGRRYVRYFNFEYQRSGTLWEGRYKSCLVQEEGYLLEVYRYIVPYHLVFCHRKQENRCYAGYEFSVVSFQLSVTAY